MTIVSLIVVAIAAFALGRFIENRAWINTINQQVAEHEADLATGTPIGSALAREMGISL